MITYSQEPVEDYIDLIPILQDLYVDVEELLNPIEKWRLIKPEQEIEKIAEKANIIIAGFSYSMTEDKKVRVLNLYNPKEASEHGFYGENK